MGACAVSLLAALALSAPAPAAASDGGVAAPEVQGATEYGKAVPVAAVAARRRPRPVATLFTVNPKSVVSGGAPPSVVLRIDQRRSGWVQARLVFLPVAGDGKILRVDLGRLHTGRRIEAPWPQGAVLEPGEYVVRLHAKGAGGTTLKRKATAAGRTGLTVTAPPPPPPPAPVPVAPAAPPAVSPGGIFPIAGPHNYGGLDSRFGARRDGHTHQGQDVAAAAGTPVVAPFAGSIFNTGYQAGGAGYWVVERGADGRDYFFCHCQKSSIGVAPGAAVAAGQQLCRVGSTGTSTGPHLHFEIWLGGWRVGPQSHPIDPLPDLQAWDSQPAATG
jgi:murein DD-endopeptidase MepM/ murein hydrolase activator NlpD